jgi:phosphopantothenoylcysteine decarboxylase/phosphopantothenate--cysteine ligase
MLRGRKILLAVTGGIAAYKSCELTRLLVKNGASVWVIMTEAAAKFVAPLTFESLTGHPVGLHMFPDAGSNLGHLDLARDADLMVVAPATANSIAKLACGLADDLMGTAALAISAPLLVCPAMNPKMYRHAAVQGNLATLSERGVHVMDPAQGPMAHPLEEPGWGRLPEPQEILDRICRLLPPEGPLSGIKLIVTAGTTHEALDPIRFVGNASSGKMGFALAQEARRRGADVRLISGPTSLPDPLGLDVIRVVSTEEMAQAVNEQWGDSRAVIMAAAPADFRAEKVQREKIKKPSSGQGLAVQLRTTTDILRGLGANKGSRILIGFALETERGLENARRKLQEKNLDLIVLNHPSPAAETGLGTNALQATLLDPAGAEEILPVTSKIALAGILLDRLERLLANRPSA